MNNLLELIIIKNNFKMNKYIFIFLLFVSVQLNAQKPASNKDPEQMPLTQQQKQILKQMGINASTPEEAMKQMNQMKNSPLVMMKGENIPTKDPKRIALINKKILSNQELFSFINKLHTAIEKRFSGIDSVMLNKYSQDLQNQYPNTDIISNIASEAMIIGDKQPALWLMGKACLVKPNDPNTLNNYAAFLLMCGAQEYAIPILNRLNVDYPNNSVILNNLGQAWFGLGELGKAKKYLDSAIIRFPGHSQATNTESEMEENNGNTDQAVASAKESLQSGYSDTKVKHIEDMGGEIGKGDISANMSMPEDPVGFSKVLAFRPSSYYYSINERDNVLPKWADFLAGCYQQLGVLSQKMNDLQISEPPTVPINSNPKIRIEPSFMCNKYKAKFKILKKEFDEFEERVSKASLPLYSAVLEKVNETIENGSTASKEKACQLIKDFQAKMFELQSKFELNDRSFVKQASVLLSELIYVKKFSTTDERSYQLDQLAYQSNFFTYALGSAPIRATAPFDINEASINGQLLWSGVPEVCPHKTPESKPIPKELPDFDIISCKDKSIFGHKDGISFTLECNVMTTEISDKYLPIHVKYKENWVKNQMIEVAGGVSVKVGGVGVTVGGSVDDKGNKSGSISVGGKVGDVGLGGTVGANVDGNGNVTGTAGVTATVGIISIGGTATVDKNGDITSQAQVGVKAGSVSAQGNINSNLDVTGKVSVSGSSSVISNVTGPLQSNAGVSSVTTLELDANGISDIKGNVSGSASSNISGGDSNNVIGTQIGANTSATGTYVWNAGGNTSLGGTLSGLSLGGK